MPDDDADPTVEPKESKAKKKARGIAAGQIFGDLRKMLEDDIPDPESPWIGDGEGREFEASLDQVARLLALPVRQGAESNTGRLGKMIDVWVAHELRRAGFRKNEVWPRLDEPRVWPAEYDRLLGQASKAERETVEKVIMKAGLSQAKVLGQHYFKQVDVLMANWDRGPELMVSTKAQMSSFGNNINNRFEEFVGDAHNLKGRYPLAAVGVVYVVRSTIGDEGDALPRVVDMLRKLRRPGLYDATCLISVEYEEGVDEVWPDPLEVVGGWPKDNPASSRTEVHYPKMMSSLTDAVSVRLDQIPDDLQPGIALERLVETVLERTPVTEHSEVRKRASQMYAG